MGIRHHRRLEFTRRTFLGGTMGVVGVAALAGAGEPMPVDLHPVQAIDRTLPVDIHTASHLLESFVPTGLARAVAMLGTRVVRDVLVPGSGQQAAAMAALTGQGVSVIGIVTRPGDSESHARRRVRAAARHGDALVRLEFASSDALQIPVAADRLHRSFIDMPMGDAPSDRAELWRTSGAATLRRWLTDLDHAMHHPEAATPHWPLVAADGLLVSSPTGWEPTPGFHAIGRFNALARGSVREDSAGPDARLTASVPRGYKVLGWALGAGRMLIVAWTPPGVHAGGAVLRLRSSRQMHWRRFAPSEDAEPRRAARGLEWAARARSEPVVVVAEPI